MAGEPRQVRTCRPPPKPEDGGAQPRRSGVSSSSLPFSSSSGSSDSAGGSANDSAAEAAGATLPSAEALRAGLEEFALRELVRQHRASFPPLWSVESWAKLLIWLALNSGCPTDNLTAFAAALDPARSARLRRLFFSREWEAEGLRLQADPAEEGVRIVALGGTALPAERIPALLAEEGLTERVEGEPDRWQWQQGVVVVPWR